MTRGLWRRLRSLVTRAVVLEVDDSGGLMRIKVRGRGGEVRDLVELLGHYGLAYRPLAGSEVLYLDLGGGHLVATAGADRRTRLSGLAPGEVALYAHQGTRIVLRADGSVEISPQSGHTKIAGDLEVTGSASVGGSASVSGDVEDGVGSMQDMRDIYNLHTHGGGPPPNQPMT